MESINVKCTHLWKAEPVRFPEIDPSRASPCVTSGIKIRPRHPCGKARGIHDFYNVMWDPHVMRGPTFKTFQQSEKECYERIKVKHGSHRRRRQKDSIPHLQIRKVLGPWSPSEESSNVNPYPGFEQFKRFLISDVHEIKGMSVGTQVDRLHVLNFVGSGCAFTKGVNVATQIEDFELFDREEMIVAIGGVLVEKISEQALLEVMEEEEILALRRMENEVRQRKLDYERTVGEQRQSQCLQMSEAKRIAWEESELNMVGRKLGTIVEQNCFSRSVVAAIKQRLLAELEKMGYLIDIVQLNIERQFIPWLNLMVGSCDVKHWGIPTEIIDDIVANVTNARQREILRPIQMDEEYIFKHLAQLLVRKDLDRFIKHTTESKN